MEIELVPFIFFLSGAQIVDLAMTVPPKEQELCTTKSDRLGVKTRLRLSFFQAWAAGLRLPPPGLPK